VITMAGLVDSVFLAGAAVKRGGRLLGVDLPALRARVLGSRDRIAAAAGVAPPVVDAGRAVAA
jgi:5-methylthioadenosine/S-adenosylhomocysteine deaminase